MELLRRWLLRSGSVDELKDERTTSHDTGTTGKKSRPTMFSSTWTFGGLGAEHGDLGQVDGVLDADVVECILELVDKLDERLVHRHVGPEIGLLELAAERMMMVECEDGIRMDARSTFKDWTGSFRRGRLRGCGRIQDSVRMKRSALVDRPTEGTRWLLLSTYTSRRLATEG